MRNGGLVLDARNLEAGGLEGADGRLAARTGALDEHGDLLHAVLLGRLGALLRSHLSGENVPMDMRRYIL